MVARVFAVNVALATLAISTVIVRSRIIDTAALSIGAVLVAGLLCTLSRGRITVSLASTDRHKHESVIELFRSMEPLGVQPEFCRFQYGRASSRRIARWSCTRMVSTST